MQIWFGYTFPSFTLPNVIECYSYIIQPVFKYVTALSASQPLVTSGLSKICTLLFPPHNQCTVKLYQPFLSFEGLTEEPINLQLKEAICIWTTYLRSTGSRHYQLKQLKKKLQEGHQEDHNLIIFSNYGKRLRPNHQNKSNTLDQGTYDLGVRGKGDGWGTNKLC